MIISISLPSARPGHHWTTRHIVLHFENRMLELATTVMMLSISGWLMVWPDALSSGSLHSLTEIVSPRFVVVTYGIFGLARIVALIANGHWAFYGPLIRAAGALVGAFAWSQMAGSLWHSSADVGHPPSIGVPVYIVLALFELISMWRALAGGHGRQTH